jgi:hypothetical protein
VSGAPLDASTGPSLNELRLDHVEGELRRLYLHVHGDESPEEKLAREVSRTALIVDLAVAAGVCWLLWRLSRRLDSLAG